MKNLKGRGQAVPPLPKQPYCFSKNFAPCQLWIFLCMSEFLWWWWLWFWHDFRLGLKWMFKVWFEFWIEHSKFALNLKILISKIWAKYRSLEAQRPKLWSQFSKFWMCQIKFLSMAIQTSKMILSFHSKFRVHFQTLNFKASLVFPSLLLTLNMSKLESNFEQILKTNIQVYTKLDQLCSSRNENSSQ